MALVIVTLIARTTHAFCMRLIKVSATRAFLVRFYLSFNTPLIITIFPMGLNMLARINNLEVLKRVVAFVAVAVVNLFAL